MADQSPSKSDINAIFKRLRSIATNKVCFDCSAKNPTWASVTYGVFICIDCSAVHRSLGVHLSFVRSTQLDTNWTWLQLRAMQVGGNASAKSYFSQHNCTSTDAQQKYNSRAAHLYREKLHGMAVNAMRLHGNKLHIDTAHDGDHSVTTPEKKEVDFFSEHSEASFYKNDSVLIQEESADSFLNAGSNIKNGSLVEQTADGSGPRVDAVLSSSPSEAAKMTDIRKPTIGHRPGVTAKKGLGVKKGGLGAQKVNTNFSEIEKEAQLADQMREKTVSEEKKAQERTTEEEAKQMASIRLAYQDLSVQKKQAEDKLKLVDPKKASQMERLGMGFSGRSGQKAHSAASEMKTIEQEVPTKPSSNYPRVSNRDFFEDDFEIIGFSSGPPKYTDSPFSREDKYSGYGSRNEDKFGESVSKNSWESEKKSSLLDETLPIKETDDSMGRSRKTAVSSTPTSDEAVKKFGNAKSISSEQFFGGSSDAEFERRANLSRFEGSSSISSADYFGESSRGKPTSPTFSSPDLDDIREGVRAGVTKVAGKLSSLANGVMNSIQDRYGY